MTDSSGRVMVLTVGDGIDGILNHHTDLYTSLDLILSGYVSTQIAIDTNI